jgi:uncharacterized membrane protein required for colicin V production
VSLDWPQLALAVVCLLLIANAARRGFLREGSLLLGLGLALWAAGRAYQYLSLTILAGESGTAWSAVLYLAVVLVLLIVAAALSALATPLVKRGPLRTLDCLAGLLVGGIEVGLLIGLLATIGFRLNLPWSPADGALTRTVELARLGFAWLAATIPSEILLQAGLH